jgi:hypothetical protein
VGQAGRGASEARTYGGKNSEGFERQALPRDIWKPIATGEGMRAAKVWSINLVVDAVLFYCLYLWKIDGNEQAGNIVLFLLWLTVVLMLLISLSTSQSQIPAKVRGLEAYSIAGDVVLISVLVYFGHFVLGSCYSIARIYWIGFKARYNDDGKLIVQKDACHE